MEWLLLWPKLGFLPQITQILDISSLFLSMVARYKNGIVCRSAPVSDKGLGVAWSARFDDSGPWGAVG